MSEEEIKDEEIDLDQLEQNLQKVIEDDAIAEEVEIAEEIEEIVDDKPTIDELLNSNEPVALSGIFSDDELKDEAVKRGYREDGKDKYGHNISPLEFLERSPIFHKMGLLRGDIAELKERQNKLIQNSERMAEKSVKDKEKLVADLKEAKDKLLSAEYLDTDDIQKVRDIDNELESHVIETHEVENNEVSNEEISAEYEKVSKEFKQDNEWYESNRAMTALADKVGTEYASNYYKENNALPNPEDTFKYVLEEVEKDFPNMGKQQRQTRVANTNHRTTTSNRPKKKTLQDIPEDQRAVARNVMEMAGISEDEYLATYKF